MTDELDRQIIAALIGNGRAPFRRLAEVLGQQERTVSRRAKKLLDTGVVRVQALPNPTAIAQVDLYLLRVSAEPERLDEISKWLAAREETHWVSLLAGANECVVELFLAPDAVQDFLYGQLAVIPGVRGFSLDPIFEYFRTVSGWRPDVLTDEQYERLGQVESPRFITRSAPAALGARDESKRALVDLLRANGRITLEEIATGLGVSKATASRRLESLLAEGIVFLRAILDPATIGYPVECLLTISAEAAETDRLGHHFARLPHVRWAANAAGTIQLQGAFRSLADLHDATQEMAQIPGVREVAASLFVRIYKRSTVVYEEGRLPPVTASA